MNANKKKALEEKIKGTIRRLEENNFIATYVNTKEDALKLVKALVPKGTKTASGGSATLIEVGVMDYLKSDTEYSDNYKDAYCADYYLVSSNAITEHGELYNVDGRSNRTSAMLYGPEKVIVIAGYNKIVPDLASAIERVKSFAAPPNTIRLSKETPCSKTGTCSSPYCDRHHLNVLGCNSKDRICANTVIMARQQDALKGRITVILVGEELGF